MIYFHHDEKETGVFVRKHLRDHLGKVICDPDTAALPEEWDQGVFCTCGLSVKTVFYFETVLWFSFLQVSRVLQLRLRHHLSVSPQATLSFHTKPHRDADKSRFIRPGSLICLVFSPGLCNSSGIWEDQRCDSMHRSIPSGSVCSSAGKGSLPLLHRSLFVLGPPR